VNSRDLVELLRLPAALTVPGDSLAGAAHAGRSRASRVWAMPVASALMYWGGMALNDWADSDVDAVERPERPIPSGRVTPEMALGTGTALCLGGVLVSLVAGGRAAARVSIPLAALIWTYDRYAKSTLVGPAVMASTRGLDVLLGSAAAPARAWQPATAVTAHTAAVTLLSRGEVHGTDACSARAATTTTAAVAAATALVALADREAPVPHRVAAVALSAGYGYVVCRAQARTLREPGAASVRTATGTGIRGLVILQSAWLARRGALAQAAGVLAVGPALRAASKVVSPT